jgi:hypothetical protein
MTDREKDQYKKELKRVSGERKLLDRRAWTAYKAANILHLGEGIFWSDGDEPDKWDTPGGAERAAENELPALDTPKQLAEALGFTVAELRAMTDHRDAATMLRTVTKIAGDEGIVIKDSKARVIRSGRRQRRRTSAHAAGPPPATPRGPLQFEIGQAPPRRGNPRPLAWHSRLHFHDRPETGPTLSR